MLTRSYLKLSINKMEPGKLTFAEFVKLNGGYINPTTQEYGVYNFDSRKAISQLKLIDEGYASQQSVLADKAKATLAILDTYKRVFLHAKKQEPQESPSN